MNNDIIKQSEIENKIFTIRGIQVMIDRDLAELYEVETKVLNQAVKRNIERFPIHFRFQLGDQEKNELVTNCDRFESLKHSSVLPYAFTEQGVSMLSAVLRSKTAIQVSIAIINTFVEMRKFMTSNATLFQRLDKVEQKQLEADKHFDRLFSALEAKSLKPAQGIFFEGQIYDAYTLVANIIRSAQKSIILIDNYIDDSVLTLLTKRNKGVDAVLFTKSISKQLRLDLEKHNAQYPEVKIQVFSEAHDRFLIIDDKELIHLGASLKDLGKKWFAFSRMDSMVTDVLNKLKGDSHV